MSEDELHETIAAKGQLEKAISRMVVEQTTAAMAKSLMSFLDRMEAAEASRGSHYELIVKGAISDAVAPLVEGFSSFGEIVSGLVLDVAALKKKVVEHDHSRDASIEERRTLRADMDRADTHRANVDAELAVAREERQVMTATLARVEDAQARIEASLAERPSTEESKRLVQLIHEHDATIRTLRQRLGLHDDE